MAYCYDGKTYETIKEMAEEYGIDRQRIYSFRRRGWSLEDAMQMCINDVRGRGAAFLNTMESYIVRLKRWLKNMDYLGILSTLYTKVQNNRRSGRSLQRDTREENYAMGQTISEQICAGNSIWN